VSTISAEQIVSSSPPASIGVRGRQRRRLGVATRRQLLRFSVSDFDDADFEHLSVSPTSALLRPGAKTTEFETVFAKFVGVKHAIAVNSFAAAMHLSFHAIGIHEDDEVITSPYTFSGVTSAVQQLRATATFVDVDTATLNIAPEQITAAITDKTRAIAPAHAGGLPSDMNAILSIAREHRIPVIESAAQTFPARESGRMIGQHGNVVCFSFHSESPIDTGQGGMICVNDDALAQQCRRLLLGRNCDDESIATWFDETQTPSCFSPMPELNAIAGLAQLKNAEQHWQRRREIAVTYNAIFSSLTELECPHDRPECQHAWHMYPLRLNQRHLIIDREQFIEELRQRNIEATVRFVPIHLHPDYRGLYGDNPERYPVAVREFEREVSLPIYSKMDDQDVKDVVDAVMDVVSRFRC